MVKRDKRFEETCKNRDLLKLQINEKFWNGQYFSDWIHKGKVNNYFSTDGNLLAILWGIADKKQSKLRWEEMVQTNETRVL